MSIRALVLGVVGTGCVAAAGVGGYLAIRENQAERALASASAPADAARPATVTPHTASRPAAAASTSRPVKPASRPAPSAAPAAPDLPPPPPMATVASDVPPAVPVVTQSSDPNVAGAAGTGATVALEPPPADPPKRMEELTVREGSVIGIRLDETISSETAKVEDKVTAKVTRDVMVNGRVAIPSGTRLEGVVTTVEHGGKFKNPGRLGLKFTELIFADNTAYPLTTEALFRAADSPGNEATGKIGASAVVGALLGGLIGGKKGAVIGGSAGAAGGTAAVAAGSAKDVVLQAGSQLTVQLTAPVTLLIQRDHQ